MSVTKLRYGLICEVNYEKGVARVDFDDIGIVSGWLTLPEGLNSNRIYEINTQVAVLMHQNREDGEILHAVPSTKQNKPTWCSKDVEGIQFADGTKVTYNSETKELTIDADDAELIFNCKKLTVNGDIKASGDIETDKNMKATGDISTDTGNITTTGGEVSAKMVALSTHLHVLNNTTAVPIPTSTLVPTPSTPPE